MSPQDRLLYMAAGALAWECFRLIVAGIVADYKRLRATSPVSEEPRE